MGGYSPCEGRSDHGLITSRFQSSFTSSRQNPYATTIVAVTSVVLIANLTVLTPYMKRTKIRKEKNLISGEETIEIEEVC
jgi:hypothetical protein